MQNPWEPVVASWKGALWLSLKWWPVMGVLFFLYNWAPDLPDVIYELAGGTQGLRFLWFSLPMSLVVGSALAVLVGTGLTTWNGAPHLTGLAGILLLTVLLPSIYVFETRIAEPTEARAADILLHVEKDSYEPYSRWWSLNEELRQVQGVSVVDFHILLESLRALGTTGQVMVLITLGLGIGWVGHSWRPAGRAAVLLSVLLIIFGQAEAGLEVIGNQLPLPWDTLFSVGTGSVLLLMILTGILVIWGWRVQAERWRAMSELGE